jgi:hypothetical protein
MLVRRSTTAAAAVTLWLALVASCAPATVTTPPPGVALGMSYTDGRVHLGATLTCLSGRETASGFLVHRSAALLCRRARALRGFLGAPPDRGRLCSQVYGGPDRALVRGRVGTTPVHRWFGRADGCQIADWRRAALLLPRPGATP